MWTSWQSPTSCSATTSPFLSLLLEFASIYLSINSRIWFRIALNDTSIACKHFPDMVVLLTHAHFSLSSPWSSRRDEDSRGDTAPLRSFLYPSCHRFWQTVLGGVVRIHQNHREGKIQPHCPFRQSSVKYSLIHVRLVIFDHLWTGFLTVQCVFCRKDSLRWSFMWKAWGVAHSSLWYPS